MPIFILMLLLAIASVAMATGNQTTEAAKITTAMDLYSQAANMQVNTPKKTELLNRAESILSGVIEKNPQSLDAHRKLMGVYLQKRDYRKATETLQNAISISAEDPKLFIALAILYEHQGAYEYALPVLEQALALAPNNQLAQEYKTSIQQKIDMQRVAMDSAHSN
ncbi:MAG: tetratricopeptide repeat protein [Gammaproteobacteria bacterium]